MVNLVNDTGFQLVINGVISWENDIHELFCEGLGPTDTRLKYCDTPGNQAVNGDNKHQPVVWGETSLLDSD